MENNVIYDELVNRCSTIEGGVNNIQSDLSTTINNGGCKSVQHGELQKSTVIYYNRNDTNPYYTVSFPISQINLEKSFWLHEAEVTPAKLFVVTVDDIKVTVTNNSVEVTFKGKKANQDASTADSTVTVSCSWQIIEFY